MKNSNISGVFTPANAVEAAKFQKAAIVLGFAWGKAGAKVIALQDGQSIRLKGDTGRMSPVSDADASLTLADVQKAVVDFYATVTTVTRIQLLQVFENTKCREIEEAIVDLLEENATKLDNEPIVVPQELLDRGSVEMTDEQKAKFAAIGVDLAHPNEKYKFTYASNGNADVDPKTLVLTLVGDNPSGGVILTDADGVIYFAQEA